ncbi:MAG TPA: hypothetical protein VGM56_26145 [Byssovorax sp.]|jgi:hypothetical protein
MIAKALSAAVITALVACSRAPTEPEPPARDSASVAGSAAPGAFSCGDRGQPTCPTQRWMRSVMARTAIAGDGPELARALEYVARRAPPDMPTWSSIAQAGADKARAGDLEGARLACKQCHDANKQRYRDTIRDRPF